MDITYTDYSADMENVVNVVEKEVNGPGGHLGYRGMYKRIRTVHNLNVPRDHVYLAMQVVDPEGLERRNHVG